MMTELPFGDLARQRAPGLAERCASLFGRKRPDRYNSIVVEDAAEHFADRLVEWAEGSVDHSRAVMDLTRLGAEGDGYAKSNRLDRLGYHADSSLVHLMDEFDDEISLAADRAVKAWVRETSTTLLYRTGDRVIVLEWETRAGRPQRRLKFTGIVVRAEPLTARYVVRIPELGHVAGGPGTIGIFVNQEDIIRRANDV